jgi:hypothetical protein
VSGINIVDAFGLALYTPVGKRELLGLFGAAECEGQREQAGGRFPVAFSFEITE